MSDKLPETIQELETPCMLVDIDRVKRNCQQMIDRCKEMGMELRPHMKTHKTIEGGVLMTNGTKRKIVVSTIDEAVFYADNGFEDILWGSPIVKERISGRLINLANKLEEFHVMVDSLQGLNGLLATPLNEGKQWSVFLEVDCGNGRTGCLWDSEEAIQIGKTADAAPNVKFQGLYTHCGNTYTPDTEAKVKVQQDTTERLVALKKRLAENGVECRVVGCGSTPSSSKPIEGMKTLTEMHPGNYIFYDYMQVLLNSCTFDDVACKVATTVVSHKPETNTIVVDCGWTAFGLDAPNEKFPQAVLGKAPVEGHPELILGRMTQELGKLTTASGKIDCSQYPLGSRLYFYPWHSCCTASLHKVYYVHSGDKIVGTWKPTNGW
ncbi:D-serine dehydratase-like [Ruditapes philippinarum]|uniref:D-serine dehydratase-like n=1 Tax=Ruditapes philippinarum TaxID=129788 RepID=UPI00295BC76E|nr:D-serine dehydratase-like [Ruditapes philippinarum]XP_060557982.1 D-serine dehydratase-like [Ruditapes philippinarum]XP_060557983.1 D-serine dehydratase-like [Ruditapes philippinarum]XP_060557984.1 D-serine dehydratase-like [Ruditapes philippinarum]